MSTIRMVCVGFFLATMFLLSSSVQAADVEFRHAVRGEVDLKGWNGETSGVDLIQSVMTHLLRNSIDHGLEFPEIREAQGKPAQGRITISARPEGSHLQIDLADDGAGLDLDRIRTLAVASSRLHSSQSLSDLALAELIFEDGLSTKAEVTQISGRGVGMSAVRRILEGSSGSIAILLPSVGYDRKHVRIAFRLLLPQDLWQSPGDRRSTTVPQTVKFQRKVL